MDEQKVKETLISWLHTLHAHPETAFEEVETARFVADKLRARAALSMKVLAVRALLQILPWATGKK